MEAWDTRDNHPVHLAKLSWQKRTDRLSSDIYEHEPNRPWKALQSVFLLFPSFCFEKEQKNEALESDALRFKFLCCSEMLIVAFLRCIMARLFFSPQLKRRSWVNDHRKQDNYKRLCKTGSLLLACQGSKANETGSRERASLMQPSGGSQCPGRLTASFLL